jgi:cytosine/adenosine deaminase-related metal-dependent hydrolase
MCDDDESPPRPDIPDAPGGPSRRDFLRSSAALAAGAAAAQLLPGQVAAQPRTASREDAEILGRLNEDPKRRILLTGGTVISVDEDVGDFLEADVLIEGKKIRAVGPNLGAAGRDGAARVIDATGMILVPGFVDCHRHSWEGQIRGIIPNGNIGDYLAITHRGMAPYYRPHDMYVGNYATAVGCIDAGITCIIDNSHNSRSPAHSDAAIKALFDSGIRAVHASGRPQFGEWEEQWPEDLRRLKREFFASDDQLVTLRMFAALDIALYQLARELDLWVTTEFSGGAQSEALLQQVYDAGLLDERTTLNHAGNISDRYWDLIREVGIKVNITPRSDSQYLLGRGIPPINTALAHGVRPGLSVDNEISYSTDMFTEMRVLFHFQRGLVHNRAFHGVENPPAPLTVRDCLEFATLRGAENAGLADKVGTLTPGKEADILLIGAEDLNTMPLNNAIGTVVSHATNRNVDAVLIAGAVRKWRGKLVGVDVDRLRREVHASRDHLATASGLWEPSDILGHGPVAEPASRAEAGV